ncbi:tryptophan 7-halogenase [Sphingomonas sp. BT-65]|uniref:tryptophan 7-halogenase n=1 Tax=Sphingomonas sp. BT-65 TaxID=2989821 RepID=UPI0022361150|nr:tryptophan 7-halogenase [Sphingomonas sp. BT-65]MCW4461499.1 tryptophan 7-halogenase [Sphingomonas sp. BT-65]
MSAPTRIVIAGSDTALWLSAVMLARALAPAEVTVTAVELPGNRGPADVHPTLPPLEALHNRIGIDEAALLRIVGGCFSLGHNFTDASGMAPAFLHAYGGAGAPIEGADFFAYWLKARRYGLPVPLEEFSLAAAAARHGRLLLPNEETELYGRSDYGYHLPALAYAQSLRSLAEKAGVAIHPAETARPVLDSERGDIVALEIGSGRIEGDLFLDATGPEAALIAAIDPARESWRAQFPADRMLAARGPGVAPIPVYAEIRAWQGGWTALHPAIAQTHVVQAYVSGACSDDAALDRARSASGLALDDAVVRPLDPGRRTAWRRNCIAIGEAACVFDPVHGVELHAIQLGLVQLLASFPAGNGSYDARRAEYNRVMHAAFERVRDFQSAHYALARYAGGFWAEGRAAPLPEAVAHAIDLFRARGEVPPFEEESFLPDSWRALFIGHGLVPDSYLPAIDRTPPDEVKAQLRRMLGFVREQVLEAPTHDQYLARIMAHSHG